MDGIAFTSRYQSISKPRRVLTFPRTSPRDSPNLRTLLGLTVTFTPALLRTLSKVRGIAICLKCLGQDESAADTTTGYDLNATILHLLGIDHERLTFRHNGLDRRLTDVHGRVVHGRVVHEVLA